MDIKRVFTNFCEQLRNRTEFTSEDTIRYYWFASMLKQDDNLNDFILEKPYEELQNKELDLWYGNQTSKEPWALEIKFHRNTKQADFAKTYGAGAIFDDLQRLCRIKNCAGINCHRLLLYVTDEVMHNYLCAGGNSYREQLKEFYNMQENGKPISFTFADHKSNSDVPYTFLESANWSFAGTKTDRRIGFSVKNIKLVGKADFEIPDTKYQSFGEDKEGKHLCHVRLYEIIQNLF